MSIFQFSDEQSIGECQRIDTARVWVRVPTPDQLRAVRVGRLVAVKGGDANEWLIGMIEKIWRTRAEAEEAAADTGGLGESDLPGGADALEDNGVQLALVGTYRALDGSRPNVFTRAVLALPSIDEKVFPIEGKALEDFMAIISQTGAETAAQPLAIGKFALDLKATAFLDANKLFQRHAALVGSTGSGKSWTVAALLEQAAKLPHPNVILFDLHGEYASLTFARQLRVAGPGDLGAPSGEVLFLPYWLLNYEEMQDFFVDRSETSAHNQVMAFHDAVSQAKRSALEAGGHDAVLSSYTIDSPVPFELRDVRQRIEELNTERVPTGKGDATRQGDFHGHFSRFLARLDSKASDRRYGFMFQAPSQWGVHTALEKLAAALLGHAPSGGGINEGVKVIDFSEVPSDVLPVIVSLVARLVFQIQFWTEAGPAGEKRHPVLMVCDEAHLYLPRLSAEATGFERRALHNFTRVAKEGRKYGVGLLIVSQRPADVSPTILSQCNNFISLRLTNGEDQTVIRRLMPESLEGILEILPTLDIGEAVIVGDAILLPTRVRLAPPSVEPISSTVNFWSRWSQDEAEQDLVAAVESMRRQSRER
ncbi:MAG: ATP-binding protein [Armatimonadetes bacterium]|nr:ATP-binding protein [Armatimonadota bacterium]